MGLSEAEKEKNGPANCQAPSFKVENVYAQGRQADSRMYSTSKYIY